jgi:hypothetical protein
VVRSLFWRLCALMNVMISAPVMTRAACRAFAKWHEQDVRSWLPRTGRSGWNGCGLTANWR